MLRKTSRHNDVTNERTADRELTTTTRQINDMNFATDYALTSMSSEMEHAGRCMPTVDVNLCKSHLK